MKSIFFSFLCLGAVASYAQPKTITQAVLTTKTTIVSPEGDAPPSQVTTDGGGGEVRIMRFGGDGETKSTTYLKNSLVKTVTDNEMNITTTIRDNDKKMTTTLMQMNGSTTGFYATDEEQEASRKQMDSLMQSRRPDGAAVPNMAPPKTEIIYVDGTKKIAGLECKKAILISTRPNRTDSNTIWYCPNFKLQGIAATGGVTGFGGRSTTIAGLDNLNGFPMQYQMMMNRGRKMTVEVTKIDIEKEVKDKEFTIPKDVKLESIKERQVFNGSGGNGNIQIRIGG